MRFSASAFTSGPVVSAELIRSVVEARCAGLPAMSFPKSTSRRLASPRRRRLCMRRQEVPHVIVHNERKQQQKEHEPHLNEAFLERQAQIAPANPFNRKQQNVPAIQNRNR